MDCSCADRQQWETPPSRAYIWFQAPYSEKSRTDNPDFLKGTAIYQETLEHLLIVLQVCLLSFIEIQIYFSEKDLAIANIVVIPHLMK